MKVAGPTHPVYIAVMLPSPPSLPARSTRRGSAANTDGGYPRDVGGSPAAMVTVFRPTPLPGDRMTYVKQVEGVDTRLTLLWFLQEDPRECWAEHFTGLDVAVAESGLGRVELAGARTRWVADALRQVDYWITAASTPSEIVERYVQLTGTPPMLPEWASGFWQCKLRYRTQDELLEVAREYRRRNLPLSVMVIDYFHWSLMGEWRFDPKEWPDPSAMVAELRAMEIEPMVSIWPTVNPQSSTYQEMDAEGFLVTSELGPSLHLDSWDKSGKTFVRYYDATHPEAFEVVRSDRRRTESSFQS